jgi:hypothetical protein
MGSSPEIGDEIAKIVDGTRDFISTVAEERRVCRDLGGQADGGRQSSSQGIGPPALLDRTFPHHGRCVRPA